MVTPELLEPVANEAVSRWADCGIGSKRIRTLQDVEFQITDLPGSTLGLALGNRIWLDTDAAGYGWFVDETPWDDAEFTILGQEGALLADNSSNASGRMDPLTVVMHELGHVLGFEDIDSAEGTADLMYETLSIGVRRTGTGLVVEREIVYRNTGWHYPRAAQISCVPFKNWLPDWFGRDKSITN